MGLSYYELNYMKWNNISYNRKKLIKFMNRYKLCKILSFIPIYNKEYKILKRIREEQNLNRINLLINNDETIIKLCLIENLSRKAATDILINNKWTKKTYKKLSNLPLSDYKLAMTRIEELIEIAKSVNNQSNKISDDVAGI